MTDAAIIPFPGEPKGPCEACAHQNCEWLRAAAEDTCLYCGDPIGYGRRYVLVGYDKRAHAVCRERSVRWISGM